MQFVSFCLRICQKAEKDQFRLFCVDTLLQSCYYFYNKRIDFKESQSQQQLQKCNSCIISSHKAHSVM